MDPFLAGFLGLLALGIGVFAAAVPQGGRHWGLLAGLTAGLAIAGLLAGGGWGGAILLDLAELSAVLLIWSHGTAQSSAAARLYLFTILPAIACTLLAHGLTGAGAQVPAGLVAGLVILGFALKLGLIPFYFWLPAMAAAAPPMTAALIIAVVDIATFGELMALRAATPAIFTAHAPVWMAIALLSMFGGALLALAQSELKRMLAFSTIADLGLLLVGLTIGGTAGMTGAWIGAFSHALSKVILFGAVGLAEACLGRIVTLDTSGLGARLPLAGFAFIVGALAFIGVPPGFGFAGYWRIYIAAAQFGGPILIAALLAAAALDLLCYARAIHRTWLGPAQLPLTGTPSHLASRLLAALAVLAVVLGCQPSLLTSVAASTLLAVAR